MAKYFGKTWWGERWLRSLSNVDYDNRLPRGSRYARNGSVLSLKIEENKIIARVSGSRKTPYKVTIIVPPFFKKDIKKLVDEIVKYPSIISNLLNGGLDPQVLEIAEKNGLKVFPETWTDFKMQCTCPDWAVPCKHIAAVVYTLSREIDNNPFLVFEIHKVDLLEELSKRNIFVEHRKKTDVVLFSKLLRTLPQHRTPSQDQINIIYNQVDFSRLQDMYESLVQLLTDNPPFYNEGNFKEKYYELISRNSKQTKKILDKKISFAALFPRETVSQLRKEKNKNGTHDSHAKEPINYHTTVALYLEKNYRVFVGGINHNIKTFDTLLVALFHLNPDHILDYQPSVVALHKILFASLHLISNGNIIPQIFRLQEKSFLVRWLPAIIDTRVRNLVAELESVLHFDILYFHKTPHNARASSRIEQIPEEQLWSLQGQAFELLSLFVTRLIVAISPAKFRTDLFSNLFFYNKPAYFSDVGEDSFASAVKVWLERYHLSNARYIPVLSISEQTTSENKKEFEMQLHVTDTESNLPPISVKSIINDEEYEKDRYKILQSLSLLSPFINGIEEYINVGTPICFDSKNFAPVLMEVLPAIRLLNIQVLLPKSLQNLLRPKPSMQIRKKAKDGKKFLTLEKMLEFDWQVALGDDVIPVEEFRSLLDSAEGLFLFKEQFIYVSQSDLQQLERIFSQKKVLNSNEMLQVALAEEYEGATITLTEEVKTLMQQLTSTQDITLPKKLEATLRPYQLRGYSWMYRNSEIGFGSIIADDMGLGKTLQVIAVLMKFKEEQKINAEKKALVVVPTGLLANWQNEIKKFSPSLASHIYHGSNRELENFHEDVLLTTYGLVRTDAEKLKNRKWYVLVIDEAQNIKNEETGQTKAVKSVVADIRIAMSGTPVENRLSEFWSIMDYANKGYLGTLKKFTAEYATPIQIFNDKQTARKFRKITSPFMMRRMKSDKSVISDLPDKIEQNQWAKLTKEQVALYQKTMNAALSEIEGLSASDSQTLFKRQGLVLQMILALKQICNHPTNFLKNNNYDATLSGKTQLLFELLDAILDTGEKVLIFTQFREMGELLEHFITEHFDEQPMFYHGGCGVKEREQMIKNFQTNRADKIFILSLKAAGTGLNLTAASHVIHYDLWWNPAVENQATDRAYRIGQKKNVMVHRLITKDTFEERIDEMIQKKKQLAEMTVSTGENWIGKLSNKELREIFA